jgi:hypothetical protein
MTYTRKVPVVNATYFQQYCQPELMKLDRKLYTKFPVFIITAEKHKRMSLYFTALKSQAATS